MIFAAVQTQLNWEKLILALAALATEVEAAFPVATRGVAKRPPDFATTFPPWWGFRTAEADVDFDGGVQATQLSSVSLEIQSKVERNDLPFPGIERWRLNFSRPPTINEVTSAGVVYTTLIFFVAYERASVCPWHNFPAKLNSKMMFLLLNKVHYWGSKSIHTRITTR